MSARTRHHLIGLLSAVAVVGLACGPQGSADTPTTDDSAGGSGSEVDDDTGTDVGGDNGDGGDDGWSSDAEPLWTADEAAAEVERGLSYFMPDPITIRDDYLQLMAMGTDDCPGSPDQINDPPVPLSGCTTEDGWTYAGMAAMVQDEELPTETSGHYYTVYTDLADFQIISPQGETFFGGGKIDFDWRQDGPDQISADWVIQGSWQNESSLKPWLASGVSAILSVNTSIQEHQPSALVEGNWSVGGVALQFDGVYFDGRICPGAMPAHGEVSLRQADSTWYVLDIKDDCSGCVDVVWNGTEDLGEACLDWTVLHASTEQFLSGSPP